MQLTTALAAFKALEECRETEHAGDPPTYTVRLDAIIVREDDSRDYQLRVQPTIWGDPRDALLFVLEQADEHQLAVELENSAIHLR